MILNIINTFIVKYIFVKINYYKFLLFKLFQKATNSFIYNIIHLFFIFFNKELFLDIYLSSFFYIQDFLSKKTPLIF